jgi:hypothetical protein
VNKPESVPSKDSSINPEPSRASPLVHSLQSAAVVISGAFLLHKKETLH